MPTYSQWETHFQHVNTSNDTYIKYMEISMTKTIS